MKDLVEYIKNSLDILVSIKLREELEKYKFNDEQPNDAREYEKLLQKTEMKIRKHISIELQLKIQCVKYKEKLDILEKEKNNCYFELVSIIFINIIIYIERNKKNTQ